MTRRLPVTSSKLAAVALVAVALSVGRVVTDHLPDGKDRDRPFVTEAGLGEEATLRWGRLEMSSVDGSSTIEHIGTVKTSPGIWVVVTGRVTPLVDNLTVGTIQLRTASGAVITASTRAHRNCPVSNPGITVSCTFAIEVAPQDAPGARLALIHSQWDDRYDDELVVDLGITEDEATAWRQRTEPIDVTTEARS